MTINPRQNNKTIRVFFCGVLGKVVFGFFTIISSKVMFLSTLPNKIKRTEERHMAKTLVLWNTKGRKSIYYYNLKIV